MTEGIGLENIDITREELQRFTAAFKHDEFKKLFADYCEEISDPANRRQYESELTQLEAERGIDVTFINPEPGYVIKTSVNGTQKAFINVAKCDRVGKPKSKCGQDASGHRGLNWSLPYTQSPARRDMDKKGQICVVYDVVFHPDTLHLAERNVQFKQLVTQTACDAVQSAFGVQIDMVNRKLPRITFKGMARPTIIRKKSTNPPTEMEPSPIDSIYPPLQEEMKNKNPKNTKQQNTTPKISSENYQVPTYQLVHRKNVELHEMTNELDAKINATIPNELVVTIQLPLLRSTDDITLDVTSQKLFLVSEVPAKYKLNIDLPYPVAEREGTAKFDKQKRKLVITLPVIRKKEFGVKDLCREDSGVELDHEDGSVDGRKSDDSDPDSIGANSVEDDLKNKVHDIKEASMEDVAHSKKEEQIIADIENSMNDDDDDSVFITSPVTTINTFLDTTIGYEMPPFACNTLGNTVAFTLHVKNIDPNSVVIDCQPLLVHVKFLSIGAGHFPIHYAFCVQFPAECISVQDAQPDVWDNNLILQIDLSDGNFGTYLAGLDVNDFKEYSNENRLKVDDVDGVVEQMNDSINVEVSAVTNEEVKIEIMKKLSTGDGKSKSKNKRKNKKQRSLSESHCEDLKAEIEAAAAKVAAVTSVVDTPVKSTATATDSIDIRKSSAKMRTYSESSNDDSQVVPKSIKGILKRRSSFARSVSESSVDDHFYSCSMDLGVGSIPEEDSEKLSENCKKTVRFDNNIRKQLYRIRSTILGQRKPQANKRKKKKRTSERRYSEGEASDYESNKVNESESDVPPMRTNKDDEQQQQQQQQQMKTSQNEHVAKHRDSGVDLSDDNLVPEQLKSGRAGGKRVQTKSTDDITTDEDGGLDLEFKSGMIFDIDM